MFLALFRPGPKGLNWKQIHRNQSSCCHMMMVLLSPTIHLLIFKLKVLLSTISSWISYSWCWVFFIICSWCTVIWYSFCAQWLLQISYCSPNKFLAMYSLSVWYCAHRSACHVKFQHFKKNIPKTFLCCSSVFHVKPANKMWMLPIRLHHAICMLWKWRCITAGRAPLPCAARARRAAISIRN